MWYEKKNYTIMKKNIVNYNFIYNKTNTKNNHTMITVQNLDAKSI